MSTLHTGRDDAAVPQRARLLPTAQRKSLIAVVAGNFLEWFDWTLYALLTTYLAANFFNTGDPQSAVLSTLAVFAGGFLARPLGGLIFGVVGDKLGRKASLVICMLLMGAGSLMIALIPSYDSIGVWASVLLLTARLAQGIAHGGESGNAYTYLAEIAPAKKRGLWGSSIMMTMLLGIMAATALSILLTSVFPKAEMLEYGWRYAFAAGALLAIFALYLRSQAAESGFFVEAKATHGSARTVTKRQLTIIAVRILMLSLLTNVLYYTWVSFASSFTISGKGMDPNGAYIATFAAQTWRSLPCRSWAGSRTGSAAAGSSPSGQSPSSWWCSRSARSSRPSPGRCSCRRESPCWCGPSSPPSTRRSWPSRRPRKPGPPALASGPRWERHFPAVGRRTSTRG